MKRLFLALLVTSNVYAAEYLEFNSFDTRLNIPTTVLAEVHFPKTGTAPYPVIITQHGSSPTIRFKNGQGSTDIFSKTVIQQGIERGFVVIAVDAFYKRGLNHNTKPQFPDSYNYATDLKKLLATDNRFSSSKLFYTGWSYGGMMATNAMDQRNIRDPIPWRAVAPSEAGCQFQPKAVKLPFPVLFVLGEVSHYPPKPCLYYADRLKEQGNDVETVVIAKANHHYSTYGMSGRPNGSLSLNGCTDNPVIRDGRSWQFADGKITSLQEATEKCFTHSGSNGKGYEDKLVESVNYIITFFEKFK
jgi:dienelactone hydrolase